MSPTENILVGIILGLIIPKRLIHEWSVLMRQSLGRWTRRHRFGLLVAGLLGGVIVLSLAFILGGIALARATQTSHDLKIQQECTTEYLSGSAPLAADRDAATQQLWDDFKLSQTIDPGDKTAQARLRTKFFDDLDKERAANGALQRYRDNHVPKEACP